MADYHNTKRNLGRNTRIVLLDKVNGFYVKGGIASFPDIFTRISIGEVLLISVCFGQMYVKMQRNTGSGCFLIIGVRFQEQLVEHDLFTLVFSLRLLF